MIIGFGGPSCSGKSTISRALAAELSATHVSLDDHFFKPGKPSPYRQTTPPYDFYPDCDRYDAIDWEGAIELIKGAESDVVVEGFLLLGHTATRNLCGITMYVNIEEDVIRSRRLQREPTHPIEYLENILLPRNQELVVPTRDYATHVLDGTRSTDALLAEAAGYIGFSSISLQ